MQQKERRSWCQAIFTLATEKARGFVLARKQSGGGKVYPEKRRYG
jgi:hypothetical protein